MVLLKGAPKPADVASQPISQSTALMILIMVVGITAFLWYGGYLRSRAALVAIAMIVAVLAYLSFWTNPVTAP